MDKLQETLGYRFKRPELLTMALTHSSYSNEVRSSAGCNERLEFLGDAVLGFVVAEYLFNSHPEFPEGKMTRLRSDLVCERSLNTVAGSIGLGSYLKLGKGEAGTGGRTRPSINADAVEAVIAAIYLDGGIEAARAFVYKFILDVYEAGGAIIERDAKSELQEVVQRKAGQTLEYRLVDEQGPDHVKIFIIEVLINGLPVARGEGRSKKDAEQHAAAKALEAMA